MGSHGDRSGIFTNANITRRCVSFGLESMQLLAHDCMGLCIAGPNALLPSVIKVRIHNTSAVSEPRTAVTATAKFTGFLNNAALRAYYTDRLHRPDSWCGHVKNGQSKKEKGSNIHELLPFNMCLQPLP